MHRIVERLIQKAANRGDMPIEEKSDRSLAYRPDIDGLRAIAVMSVIGFHYWSQYMPGGYVGVDVFFVISGYLLGAIIIAEVQMGRFTFRRFYERRIRRIFPALFALLGFTTLAAYFLDWPSQLLTYCRTMATASLSCSNFYFWLTSNYFDAGAKGNPLLHTWSLGVEEQFYIVLPVFVVLVYRFFPRHLRAAVTIVTIVSLAWSIVDVRLDRTAAFYLPFTRAWELMFGVLLTLRVIPAPSSKLVRECLTAFGLAAIVASVFVYSDNTSFPGEFSLLPCCGAGAIILAGQNATTLINRLLSVKPIVFIGLISYSLYLWHWPLLVFFFDPIERLPKHIPGAHVILLVLSILIAAASWKFVETPFRTGSRRPTRRAVYLFGCACVLASTATLFIIMLAKGLPGRFPAAADSIAQYADYQTAFPSEFRKLFRPGCFMDVREPVSDFNQGLCLATDNGKPQALIFGDSHAADIAYGLETAFPGVHFMEATRGQCHPALEVGRTSECRDFVKAVLEEWIPRRSISLVVINADWSPGEFQAYTETINYLHSRGVSVVMLGPRPQYEHGGLPSLLADAIVQHNPDLPRRNLNPNIAPLDEAMSRMARTTWHVPYVSVMSILCPNSACVEYAAPQVPVQWDYAHLTLAGSSYIGQEISKRFPLIFAQHQYPGEDSGEAQVTHPRQ